MFSHSFLLILLFLPTTTTTNQLLLLLLLLGIPPTNYTTRPVYTSMSLLHFRCLSSGHASRLISSPFPIPVPDHVHDHMNTCLNCTATDTCHSGHFNRLCYLLTYHHHHHHTSASSNNGRNAKRLQLINVNKLQFNHVLIKGYMY